MSVSKKKMSEINRQFEELKAMVFRNQIILDALLKIHGYTIDAKTNKFVNLMKRNK